MESGCRQSWYFNIIRCKKYKCGIGMVVCNEQTENLADHAYTAVEAITSKKI